MPPIVRGHRVLPESACDHPVSLLDICPTLPALAELPSRQELDGGSLAGLLDDPCDEPDRPAGITFKRGNHAVRRRDLLYVQYRDGGEELYNRSEDPVELTNVAGQEDRGGKRATLRALLPTYSAALKSDCAFDPEVHAWTKRRRGLWREPRPFGRSL